MDARYCPKCGIERVQGLRFCASCGLDLEAITASATSGSTPATMSMTPEMTRPTGKITRNQYIRAALVGGGVYLAVSIVAGYLFIGTATNMGVVGLLAGMAAAGKVAGATSIREWALAGLLTFACVLVVAYLFIALVQVVG